MTNNKKFCGAERTAFSWLFHRWWFLQRFCAYRLACAVFVWARSGARAKPRGVGARYFLFLYMAVCSFIVLTSVKPASISCISSSVVWLTLTFHSSVLLRNVACSRLIYTSVVSLCLCPKMYCTCLMSLVLWYSVVPFQCLRVWNPIFNKR